MYDAPPVRGASVLPPELDPRRKQRTRSRRGRLVARALSWLAVFLSVSVLAVTGVGYVLVAHYNGHITHVSLFHRTKDAAPALHGDENVLLVGSDTRAGTGDQQYQGTGADYVTGQRSDTMILMHIPGDGSKVTMLSLPRDSYVQIPSFRDAKGVTHPAIHDKLNAAFSDGGPQLTIDTIEQLSGLRVDHYLQVDFAGFKSIVNALGGVNVCILHPAHDSHTGLNLSAGTHHIDGDTALAFVRQRYGLSGGDLDRIKRQQFFLSAVIKKVLSEGTLLNPLKMNAFLNNASSALTTDMSTQQLLDLGLRLRHLDGNHVAFTTLPIASPAYRAGSGDVLLIDDAGAQALFDRLRNDDKPSPAPAASGTTTPTVPPAEVSVRVENAAGTAGLASRASSELARVGFSVVGVGNATTTGATTTVIRSSAAGSEAARTVAAAIPGATVQVDPSVQGNTVIVDVGSDWSGARSVTVATPAQPPASSYGGTGGAPVTVNQEACAP